MVAVVTDPEAFVQLLTQSQRRLYAYILTIVVNETAAHEVLSETNTILWQKRDEFELGTDFTAWALRVAYFRVLAYRKQRRLDRHIFDGELLEDVAQAAIAATQDMSEKQSALARCLEKLTSDDRQLLNMRYDSTISVQDLARRRGKSANAISHALFRIRSALMECVERTLRSEPSK